LDATTGGIFGMYVPMHYLAYPFPDGSNGTKTYEENKLLQMLKAKGDDANMTLVEA
jgi:hypothetical protein